jgi:hypothetical protein
MNALSRRFCLESAALTCHMLPQRITGPSDGLFAGRVNEFRFHGIRPAI